MKTKGSISKLTMANHKRAIEIYLKEVEWIKSLDLYDYVSIKYYIDTVANKTGYSKDAIKKIIYAYKITLNQSI